MKFVEKVTACKNAGDLQWFLEKALSFKEHAEATLARAREPETLSKWIVRIANGEDRKNILAAQLLELRGQLASLEGSFCKILDQFREGGAVVEKAKEKERQAAVAQCEASERTICLRPSYKQILLHRRSAIP